MVFFASLSLRVLLFNSIYIQSLKKVGATPKAKSSHTPSPHLFFQHSNIDAWIYSSYPSSSCESSLPLVSYRHNVLKLFWEHQEHLL